MPTPLEETASRESWPTALRRHWNRMGRRDRRWSVAGVVLVLVMTVLSVWWGWSATVGTVNWQNVAYHVVDDRTVEVRFQVTKPAGSTARCTLQAQEVGHAVVGRTVVVVPPAAQSIVEQDATIRTTTPAVIGQVKDCELE